MDAFEQIVAECLEQKGYWVKQNYKVRLTPQEKQRIGLPTRPRWELDIIAYKPGRQELLFVECKSLLDSRGVKYSAVAGNDSRRTNRYKLFNNRKWRRLVLKKAKSQLVSEGAVTADCEPTLCLAAGKITSKKDRVELKAHFAKQGWLFFDPDWVREALEAAGGSGYENSVSVMVAKLLLRAKCK